MGLITMSERDLQRIEILSKVVAGHMTMVSAAHVLDLSERQVRRLLERMRTDGAASIRHKAIGRPSNNRINDGIRDYAVALVRERYTDFGPTLATEKLAERDGLHVSRETLRNWMVDAGIWLSRKQRRTFHQPRLRREACGELVQIDGSEHRCFEDRGPSCFVAGTCRRFDRQVDAVALRAFRKRLQLFRGIGAVSQASWRTGGLLFGQAFSVPGGKEGCQGRSGHDAVRAGAL